MVTQKNGGPEMTTTVTVDVIIITTGTTGIGVAAATGAGAGAGSATETTIHDGAGTGQGTRGTLDPVPVDEHGPGLATTTSTSVVGVMTATTMGRVVDIARESRMRWKMTTSAGGAIIGAEVQPAIGKGVQLYRAEYETEAGIWTRLLDATAAGVRQMATGDGVAAAGAEARSGVNVA